MVSVLERVKVEREATAARATMMRMTMDQAAMSGIATAMALAVAVEEMAGVIVKAQRWQW
jgi:hypothetical protein